MSHRKTCLVFQSVAAILTAPPAALFLDTAFSSEQSTDYYDYEEVEFARAAVWLFAVPAAAFLLNLFVRRDSPMAWRIASNIASGLTVLTSALPLLTIGWVVGAVLLRGNDLDGASGSLPIMIYFGVVIALAVHGARDRPTSRKAERQIPRPPPP